MKTKLIFLSLLILGFLNLSAQQCNPVITSPRLGAVFADKMLFCDPSESEVLSTTQAYATYQWYRQKWDLDTPNPNPWVAVPGATSQNLTVNGADDFLYYFKVAVTQSGCTAESSPILVDGYVYGLPYMITEFQPGTFEQIGDGEFNVCQGSSVKFSDGYAEVYGTHTWFKCLPSSNPPSSSEPCIIPGVTGHTYTATTDGRYGFYACTTYCPNQCEMLSAGGFCKLNFGNWNFCNNLSTGETKIKDDHISIYPNPTSQFLFIGKDADKKYTEISIIDMSGKLIMQKKDHENKQAIDISHLVSRTYMIVAKSSDGKLYRNKFIKK